MNEQDAILMPYVEKVQAAVPDAGLSYAQCIAILQAFCDFDSAFVYEVCPIINAQATQIGIQ